MNGNGYTSWVALHPPPDFQQLVERWGGYWQIPREAWERHQAEMKAWQSERLNRWVR